MSAFVPQDFDLRASLRFCFFLKKNATEAHRMLQEAYGEHALSETACREWFRRFKSGDFDLKNGERGRPSQKFGDEELQALLDQNGAQTQLQLADQLKVSQQSISRRLKAMGKIRKVSTSTPAVNLATKRKAEVTTDEESPIPLTKNLLTNFDIVPADAIKVFKPENLKIKEAQESRTITMKSGPDFNISSTSTISATTATSESDDRTVNGSSSSSSRPARSRK